MRDRTYRGRFHENHYPDLSESSSFGRFCVSLATRELPVTGIVSGDGRHSSSGSLPLGNTNAIVILYSTWQVCRGRHTMAPHLIAAVVVFVVCGFWDIPQVRSYAAVMGGIAMGIAAGPLIGRPSGLAKPAV